MQSTAQTPVRKGHQRIFSGVPSPHSPAGHKREHRQDSRQWSVSSSRSRQGPLQDSAPLSEGRIPSPKTPVGQKRVHTPVGQKRVHTPVHSFQQSRNGSEQISSASKQNLGGSVPDNGTTGRDAPETPSRSDEGTGKDDVKDVRRRGGGLQAPQGASATRHIGNHDDPIQRGPRAPAGTRPSHNIPASRQGEIAARENPQRPGRPAKEAQKATFPQDPQGQHWTRRPARVGAMRAETASAPSHDFMQLSSSDSSAGEGSSGKKRVAEALRQSQARLVSTAPRRHKSTNERIGSVEASRPIVRTRSTPFFQQQHGSGRPSWANIGHYRMVSWPSQQQEGHAKRQSQPDAADRTGHRVERSTPAPSRRRSIRLGSDASTMSDWMNGAIDAVMRKSVEVGRDENKPRHSTTCAPPLPPRSSRRDLQAAPEEMRHFPRFQHLPPPRDVHPARRQGHSVATAQNLRGARDSASSVVGGARLMTASTNTAVISEEAGPSEGKWPGRFLEHVDENAERLKKLGVAVSPTRGCSWLTSFWRRTK